MFVLEDLEPFLVIFHPLFMCLFKYLLVTPTTWTIVVHIIKVCWKLIYLRIKLITMWFNSACNSLYRSSSSVLDVVLRDTFPESLFFLSLRITRSLLIVAHVVTSIFSSFTNQFVRSAFCFLPLALTSLLTSTSLLMVKCLSPICGENWLLNRRRCYMLFITARGINTSLPWLVWMSKDWVCWWISIKIGWQADQYSGGEGKNKARGTFWKFGKFWGYCGI